MSDYRTRWSDRLRYLWETSSILDKVAMIVSALLALGAIGLVGKGIVWLILNDPRVFAVVGAFGAALVLIVLGVHGVSHFVSEHDSIRSSSLFTYSDFQRYHRRYPR